MTATPQRLLLTGATGHLGAAILAELGKRPDAPAMRLLVRSPEKLAHLVRLSDDFAHLESCEVAVADLRDPSTLEAAVEGVDVIIHAAHNHEYWRGSDYLADVNVEGARRLLDACARTGELRRLVAIGSYSAPLLDEAPTSADLQRLAPRECSSRSKLATYRLFADRAGDQGFELDMVSPSYMIGPYQLDPTYFGALFHLVRFRPLSWAPPHGVNMVDVRDVAKSVVDVLGRPGGQSVLAGGDNVPFSDLFRLMNRAAGWENGEPRTLSPRLLRLSSRRIFGDFGKHYFDRPHFVDAPGLPDRRHDLAATAADAIAWARDQQLFKRPLDIYRWAYRRYF